MAVSQACSANTMSAGASTLPMGSLFEGALFILFEVMVLKLIGALKIDRNAMRARHTNLE